MRDKRSGDCQTSAPCSAATKGQEVVRWRGEIKKKTGRREVSIARNRKGKSPSVQEIKEKKSFCKRKGGVLNKKTEK